MTLDELFVLRSQAGVQFKSLLEIPLGLGLLPLQHFDYRPVGERLGVRRIQLDGFRIVRDGAFELPCFLASRRARKVRPRIIRFDLEGPR